MSLSRLGTAMLVLAGLAAPVPAAAQSWPTRPITIVVPFPPGPLDVVARWVAPKLSEALGQPVVVDHRAGANGAIGSKGVALAAPDGATILAGTVGTHVTSLFLSKSLPYDPIKDFTPIVAAVEPVTCLVVHASVPVNSVAELIAYAKQKPGELSYGTSGIGSVFHLMGELFNQTTGREAAARAVPRGRPGHAGRGRRPHPDRVHVGVDGAAQHGPGPHQDPGGAGADAVREARAGAVDLRDDPGVPASRRAGSATSARPDAAAIVARLNQEIQKGLNAPDVLPKLHDNGYAVIGGSPEAFAALMRDGIERYGAIIKTAGIQAE